MLKIYVYTFMLYSSGTVIWKWNVPPDHNPSSKKKTSIRYEIKSGSNFFITKFSNGIQFLPNNQINIKFHHIMHIAKLHNLEERAYWLSRLVCMWSKLAKEHDIWSTTVGFIKRRNNEREEAAYLMKAVVKRCLLTL